MGEVYLGLQEGIGGLERLVVIKRIYPQFCEDEHFTRMLLEEARLAASIRHPNVVQIHDIGRDADGYFIAMEYLSGETLVYITRTLRARGQAVPPAIACRIGAEVAAGLHCAHTATDPASHPQPIVHRDVTPSNLIVCFNGAVKIVDFGVAKATLHEGHTRGGVKGKMSYLAPEQLYDKPIDGRTDVFQLGICLHEFLTGSRLFKGTSDQQRAVAVLEQRIPPPSELVPSLPKVLDEVILWALERDPGRRPTSADEFRRALETAATGLDAVSSHDLGEWMKSSFEERLAERTHFERQCVAEMREGRSSGERPATSPSAAGSLLSITTADGHSQMRSLPVRTRVPSLSPPPASETDSLIAYQQRYQPQTGSSNSSVPPPEIAAGAPIGRWALILIVGLSLLTAGIAIAWRLGASRTVAVAPPAPPPAQVAPAPRPAPPRQFEVAVTVVPAEAVIELDGIQVGRGSFRTTLPVNGTRHILTVRAEGHETVGLDFTDQAPSPRVELKPIPAAPAPARQAAERPARRSAPAPAPRRAARPRARSADADELAPTDNPDPWADGSGRSDAEKPEGSQ
jgi:serine/threonine-protein kinase